MPKTLEVVGIWQRFNGTKKEIKRYGLNFFAGFLGSLLAFWVVNVMNIDYLTVISFPFFLTTDTLWTRGVDDYLHPIFKRWINWRWTLLPNTTQVTNRRKGNNREYWAHNIKLLMTLFGGFWKNGDMKRWNEMTRGFYIVTLPCVRVIINELISRPPSYNFIIDQTLGDTLLLIN